MFKADAGRRAVVLTGDIDGFGGAEATFVFGQGFGFDLLQPIGAPRAQLPVQVEARVAADHSLGQRRRLDQMETSGGSDSRNASVRSYMSARSYMSSAKRGRPSDAISAIMSAAIERLPYFEGSAERGGWLESP